VDNLLSTKQEDNITRDSISKSPVLTRRGFLRDENVSHKRKTKNPKKQKTKRKKKTQCIMEGKGENKSVLVEADPGHDVVKGESDAAEVASDAATCGRNEVD
jgi:hypothetical protein